MSTPAPAAPTPIDYDAMYAAAQKYGGAMLTDQTNAMLNLYPQMTNLQFQAADQMAQKLDNSFLKVAQYDVANQLVAARTPSQIEAELMRQAQAGLTSGPTNIQQQLLSDAEAQLALGRSLSPEQERAAQQAARSAYSATGLGTSNAAAAAEILNRDAYATQRENERRAFAVDAENYVLGQEASRRDFANLANQLDIARGDRLIGLTSAYAGLDPYRQGLNAAFGLGSSTLNQATNTATSAYNNALNTAGMVDSFNRNMQASQYNSWQNNNAAVQGANMQAGAMRDAGMMNMIGNIGSSIFSDKRMKKDIKPLGSAGKVLGLTAYEFKYKGDDEKRVGFMAQDVQKVLPEAVEERTVKGKKRLAIKPAVIGAALAQELTQAKAA
jgi:hypothetical protein